MEQPEEQAKTAGKANTTGAADPTSDAEPDTGADTGNGSDADAEPDDRDGAGGGGDAAAASDAEAGGTEEASPSDGRQPRPGRPLRALAMTVSVLGELLITAGIVLGLFVTYSLWWTNVLANQEAQRDGNAVRDLWEQSPPDPEIPPEYNAEEGIGFLHVPAMTGDEILVKEGIDLSVLNGGVAGYYDEPVESAMPWDDEGNFSLAAHRDGHGAKFHNIHKLDDGDAIVFETRDTWYIYKVYATLPETSRFNTAVLDPVPEESGVAEPGQYITLTTCTPVYTSTYRYIVWGELERTEEVDEMRTPPVELRED